MGFRWHPIFFFCHHIFRPIIYDNLTPVIADMGVCSISEGNFPLLIGFQKFHPKGNHFLGPHMILLYLFFSDKQIGLYFARLV
jgi:hypothetical protein